MTTPKDSQTHRAETELWIQAILHTACLLEEADKKALAEGKLTEDVASSEAIERLRVAAHSPEIVNMPGYPISCPEVYFAEVMQQSVSDPRFTDSMISCYIDWKNRELMATSHTAHLLQAADEQAYSDGKLHHDNPDSQAALDRIIQTKIGSSPIHYLSTIAEEMADPKRRDSIISSYTRWTERTSDKDPANKGR